MKFVLSTFVFVIISVIFSINVSSQPYLVENASWQNNLSGIAFSSQVIGDIDGDSNLDIVTIGVGNNGIKSNVYVNNGTGLIESVLYQQDLVGLNYGSIALGDIDNDGDLDLLMTGCNGSCHYSQACNQENIDARVYINNGTTFLENSTWEGYIEKSWRGSIALGDIDNDGDLDLILTGQNGSTMVSKVYINNGTTFLENSTWENNLTNIDSSGISLGDIDNDGDLDLIISGRDSTYTSQTKVYINNGTMFLENSTWQSSLIGLKDSSVTLGDIDNDGDLDLSLIGCCDIHRTYNNTGNTFQQIQEEITHFAGVFAGSISFGDYDNDGYVDMATTGREKYTSIYMNYGNGSFTDYWNRPEQQIMDMEYSYVMWGDIDSDDNLDLILTGWGGGGGGDYQAKIYANNITNGNNPPNSPSSDFNANSNFSTGKLTLEWGNGSDAETPTLGLYYNLRAGTCSDCHDVVSDVFGGGDDNGYFGNMMQRKQIVLNRPDLENKTIYWAVQTIDTGLAKSNWSAEQIFNMTQNATQSCTENWTYGEWSSCVDSQQTRTATDLNGCGTTVNKSATTQSCTSYTPPSGGGTYVPPIVKKNETNGTNTSNTGGGFDSKNTSNASGNISAGASAGSEINGGNQSMSICVPFDVRCDGNNLLECVASGMEWTVKQICEFGCADGECKERPSEAFSFLWIILPAIAVVAGAIGVYFLKIRK